MQFIKPDVNIDFVSKRTYALYLSCILIAIGIVSLLIRGGPNYGIDFAGGTLVQVKFNSPTSAVEIKKAVTGTGRATKEQVAFMVQQQLRLKDAPSPADAADGVAAALCHCMAGAIPG